MTQTKKQAMQERIGARAWYTAGRMIDWSCPRCGASSLDMATRCAAPLNEPCPGFVQTEKMYEEFERNYNALLDNA